MKADIGDHVKAGDVLAVISNPELQLQTAAAAATMQAKQQLAAASVATIEQAKALQQVADRELAGSQADLKLSRTALKRQEDLFAGKAITDQQLDDARTKALAIETVADVAKAKVTAAASNVKVAEAEHAVADAQVLVAAAEVKRLQALLNYLKIVAPFDGVITRRLVNRGDLAQTANAGRAAMFLIQRLDTVRIVCDVPEAFAGRVSKDTVASIQFFNDAGAPIEAPITRIAGALNADTRTMRVEIHLPNADEQILPGAYAQVTLKATP